MFEFIFGHYTAISAFATGWHDHDRRVFTSTKLATFFAPKWEQKTWTNSYVAFSTELFVDVDVRPIIHVHGRILVDTHFMNKHSNKHNSSKRNNGNHDW